MFHRACKPYLMLVPDPPRGYIFYPPTFPLPSNQNHFQRWFTALEDISSLPSHRLNLTIDFHYCKFLSHSAVALLGGIARLIEHRGGQVIFNWETLHPKIHTNLAQNGFLYEFDRSQSPWDGNSVPYRSDRQHHSTAIGDYLKDKWLGKGWVSISEQLQNLIAGQVSELYLNAFDHSQSEVGVFSCGQHYPKACCLHLTVVDLGIGIPASVRLLPENKVLSTCEALEWAFTPGKTTQKGICGGMGLYLLQDFVTKNHGILTIFSNDGHVFVGDNGIKYENICTNLAGTIIDIALRCDEYYYCLASEVIESEELWF